MTLHQRAWLLLTVGACLVVLLLIYQQAKTPRLEDVIRTADMVEVTRKGRPPDSNGIGIAPYTLATLVKNKTYVGVRYFNPPTTDMLGLFRNSRGLHRGSPRSQPDLDISVVTRMHGTKEVVHLSYASKSGEVGLGQNWFYVPSTLRDWIKTVPRPKAIRYRQTNYGGMTVTEPLDQ